MCVLQKFALMLIVIGAVNGGLIGLFQYVLDVAVFGGQHTGFSRIIYSIGGIAGLLSLSLFFSSESLSKPNFQKRPPY
ncbi:hypothetical protein SAFG77S_09508 [Streptomyces afghaniensis]|jgi:uncharacterized protein